MKPRTYTRVYSDWLPHQHANLRSELPAIVSVFQFTPQLPTSSAESPQKWDSTASPKGCAGAAYGTSTASGRDQDTSTLDRVCRYLIGLQSASVGGND